MRSGPLRIAAFYIVFALMWIALSDRILFLFHNTLNPDVYLWLNSAKGFLFVIITGFLLYKLIMIDERKLLESYDQQRRSDDELKRLADIVTLVNNMIIITDEHNHITWINKAVEDQTGFQFSEVAGKSPADFLVGPETDMDVLNSIIERKKALEFFVIDIGCYTKCGDRLWVYGEFTPLFDDSHKHTGYIAVYNDITWRKQKEDEVTRQNNKLREVAWLNSHEVRRPLANIMGLINLMKTTSNMDEKMKILENINNSAKELDKIVHDINLKVHTQINSDFVISSE
jgi:PAS domain S-box-containing protein